MAQISGYKDELQNELQKTDPDSHASRLLAQEIARLEKGDDKKDSKSVAFIDVHGDQPQNLGLKIRIPNREFPRFNFVGKLLGPKGFTLKRLQEETGCKMAVLGKGSMRDKTKEEEMRKEGGKKFSHLNDELHVNVEVFSEVTEGYRRLSLAVSELKKFLIPENDDDIRQQQIHEMMYIGGGDAPRGGRGGFRGGPSGRGGPPSGRGAPMRGGAGAPSHGAPGRGGAAPPPRGASSPLLRGGSRGRGGAPPPPSHPQPASYDEYGYSGPSHGGGGGYDDGYSSRGYAEPSYDDGQRDSQYYGSSSYSSRGQSAVAGYDEYSGYDYGDSWGTNGSSGGPMKPASRGGAPKPRSHPYGGY